MGFFDSTQKQKSSSSLTIPDWMKGMPEEIANQVMALAGRTPPSPEERVAPWSGNLTSGVNSLANFGATNNAGDVLGAAGTAGVAGLTAGQDILKQAAAMGPGYNAGLDMSKVGEIANNPYTDSMVAAALRDPTRQFQEQTMPTSRMAQAGSGNTMGARGAFGDAVLRCGLEDRAADVSAGIRGAAYDRGLGIEGARAEQNAGLQNQFAGILGNVGGTLAQTGVAAANVAGMGHDINLKDIMSTITAGQMETAQDQALKDVGYSNWLQPMDAMNWASSIVNPMASQYGTKTQSSSSTSSPSAFSSLLAAGSVAMGVPGAGGMFSSLMGGGPKGAGAGGNLNLGTGFGDPYQDQWDLWSKVGSHT